MIENAEHSPEMSKDARIVWYDGDTFHQNYPSLYPHRKYCLSRRVLLPEYGLGTVFTMTPVIAQNCLRDNLDQLSIPTLHLCNDAAKLALGHILNLPGVVVVNMTPYDFDVYVAQAFDFKEDHLHERILRILADTMFRIYCKIKVIDRDRNSSLVIYNP